MKGETDMCEREGWKFIGFRVTPELRKRLNIVLAHRDESVQEVLERMVLAYVEESEVGTIPEPRRQAITATVATSERPLYSISKAEQGSKKRDRVEEEGGVGYEGE
jgi:hypothetical protein